VDNVGRQLGTLPARTKCPRMGFRTLARQTMAVTRAQQPSVLRPPIDHARNLGGSEIASGYASDHWQIVRKPRAAVAISGCSVQNRPTSNSLRHRNLMRAETFRRRRPPC
jgi:hypothetical protein